MMELASDIAHKLFQHCSRKWNSHFRGTFNYDRLAPDFQFIQRDFLFQPKETTAVSTASSKSALRCLPVERILHRTGKQLLHYKFIIKKSVVCLFYSFVGTSLHLWYFIRLTSPIWQQLSDTRVHARIVTGDSPCIHLIGFAPTRE